jgi:hypothetical protein
LILCELNGKGFDRPGKCRNLHPRDDFSKKLILTFSNLSLRSVIYSRSVWLPLNLRFGIWIHQLCRSKPHGPKVDQGDN